LRLEKKLSARTVHHVHTVLGACLKAAVRKGLIGNNPVERAEAQVPGENEAGMVIEEDRLRVLVEGFRGLVLFPIVAALAFTGARRTEALGLQRRDLDITNKTLRIERAVEKTKKYGLSIKEPKRARHKRTIAIDDDLIKLLLIEREKHLRIAAGVPEGASVDLSLVKLPDNALMFRNPPMRGESFSFTRLRDPDRITKLFAQKARALGLDGFRLHDLRGTHETLLLDRGVPVHVVAARCGHDPAVLLRIYAKRTRKADTSAADAIAALSKGVLGT
jgi:integrase